MVMQAWWPSSSSRFRHPASKLSVDTWGRCHVFEIVCKFIGRQADGRGPRQARVHLFTTIILFVLQNLIGIVR
jgi:hypothetical protein